MKITETNSILFVDSDHNQLQSLKRALHDHQNQWQLHFTENAASALDLLQQMPVDIIVTETKLNGSNGSSLLKTVQSQFPGTTRLLFSGQALRTPAQEVVHHAHQFIAKPCNTKDLINNLERVLQLRGLLNNPAMEEMINSLGTLPSLPQSYREMIDALQSENTTLADIGKIVAQDIGMSAKLLQMVNSAFFGLPQKIASPAHAVSLLGIETVSNLALGAGVFSQLDQAVIKSFQLELLWEHSQSISGLVRRLAQLHGMSRQEIEIPVMAGLLHDIGKLVLASQNTKEYLRIVEQSKRDKIPLFEVEADALWCHHASIGAYLMGIWGLPFTAVEAVALHHSPEKQTMERPDCLLVYGANLLYHWLGDTPYKEHYNPEHLQSLLGPEEYDRWVVATEEHLNGQTI
ncbi:MAG: response regulator [Candidatus Thiodiazotropha sp.]|jgi:HD-like signal output (HDOD) protein/ActR/RegA family two-component response regulator